MCLIAVAWQVHPRFPLALIANRDEFHGRAAAPAAHWSADGAPDHSSAVHSTPVYGGRDLEAGGAWLLASAAGRLAAVTNVRVGRQAPAAPRSRGALVHDFAAGTVSAPAFTAQLAPIASEFGRYNLLAWDGTTLQFASNHPQAQSQAVSPGIHAMSNGAFDAAWPKSGHATRALRAWLDSPAAQHEAELDRLEPLFAALADTAPAPDAALPDTGIGLDMERWLSPPFVRGERYGTRCSTVVLVSEDTIAFAERRFGADARPLGDSFARLALSP